MTRLEELLELSHLAIRRADFVAAAALAPEIETALSRLGDLQDRALLARLKVMGARNETLIDAARKGLRSARRRVEEVRRAAQGIQSYDGSGRRTDIPPNGRTAGRF